VAEVPVVAAFDFTLGAWWRAATACGDGKLGHPGSYEARFRSRTLLARRVVPGPSMAFSDQPPEPPGGSAAGPPASMSRTAAAATGTIPPIRIT
jgi:hypothetical protein